MFRNTSTAVLAGLMLLGLAAVAQAKMSSTSTASSRTSSAWMSHAAKQAPKHAMMSKKDDLNGASREELMELPGVSGAMANKIIAARPFKSKHELLTKRVVSRKEYRMIARRVFVKNEPLAASNKEHK